MALPDKPNLEKNSWKDVAILGAIPLSSRAARNNETMRINGKKLKTAPKPEIIPSLTNETIQWGAAELITAENQLLKAVNPASSNPLILYS